MYEVLAIIGRRLLEGAIELIVLLVILVNFTDFYSALHSGSAWIFGRVVGLLEAFQLYTTATYAQVVMGKDVFVGLMAGTLGIVFFDIIRRVVLALVAKGEKSNS